MSASLVDMKRFITAVLVLGVSGAVALVADEGMWTFDNFPRAAVQQKYGVNISDQWLDRLQQSVVRLETFAITGSRRLNCVPRTRAATRSTNSAAKPAAISSSRR